MPKRKNVDKCDRIKRKIRRLERKLRRNRRRNNSECSSCGSSETPLIHQGSDDEDQRLWTEDEYDAQNRSLLPTAAHADCDLVVPGTSRGVASILSVVTVPPSPAGTPHPQPADTPHPQPADTQSHGDSLQPAAPGPSPSSCPAPAAPEIEILDNELLNILGTDPTTDKKYGKDVHKDLSIRLQHWVTNGLNKEIRSEFKKKYLTPENCKLIDPPALNPEIKAAVSDMVVKKDLAIEGRQKQLTLALSSLSEAISLLLSSKDRDNNLLKLLMDSARILADCQHDDSLTRRRFLISSVRYDMKDHIQNTKVDAFLFGENLLEVLKSAKAINKTGTEIKLSVPRVAHKKQIPNSSNSKNLNSKNPGPTHRRTGPPRMKPVTTSTRNRHTTSSRQSQRHHQRDRPAYHRR